MTAAPADHTPNTWASFGPHHPTTIELRALERAFALAAQGPADTPNPQVGCVLLDAAGQTLATGWHRGAGSAHAEAHALERAQANNVDVRGATAIVSLEPCAHQGRTPSCAGALLAAGITRVIFSVPDPTAAAHGGGQLLQANGVVVVGGMLEERGRALLAPWFAQLAQSRVSVPEESAASAPASAPAPWIVAKWAMTLDGKVAALDGSSQWITGPLAREQAHELRSHTQALIVGTGTVAADNPRLTARTSSGLLAPHQPLKVVVGRRDIPADSLIRAHGTPVLQVRSHNPAHVVSALASNAVSHAIIDGGPTLISAFLAAGLVNEIHAYIAPKILGGGTPVVQDLGISTLTSALHFDVKQVQTLGPDTLITLVRPLG